MDKKIVLILYEQNKTDSDQSFLKNWEDLYSYGKKNGILFCRAAITSFDQKNKRFKRAQFFEKNWFFQKNVTPDLVYDKSTFALSSPLMRIRKKIEKAFPFYNPLELSELLSNKWLTYKLFPEFSPKAFLISGKKDLPKLKKLHSEKIIFKPLQGSGGKGIRIFDKKNFHPTTFPFFAQELIEIKTGTKNFVAGAHDLRIMIANEKIFYAYLRIPKKGSLLANTSQGGTIKVIQLKKLPPSIIPFIKKIQTKLKKYPTKLYSVDLILDDHGQPRIIEMNARPGLVLAKEESLFRQYFFDNLIKFFKQAK